MTSQTTSTSQTTPPTRLLYMVGNAHIDPVWLWQWQEGFHQIRATFRSALDRMDEYEDFIFTCDSVAYLEWVERVDPQMFATITRRVAEGRFVVVGGWWVEPDCNLPHGESFVRQALYSQRFLQDRFGLIATVGCNVDPFGHAATLPQLLAKSGMDFYLFLRPEPKEKMLRFGPGEIKAFLVPDHLEDAVQEVSLLEWPHGASLEAPRSRAQMATQRGCPPPDGSSHFIVP